MQYHCHGERCHHLNVRVDEDSSTSPWTEKKSKTKTTVIAKGHMLFRDLVVSLKDLKILANGNSEFHLKIKESLLISREKPVSNRFLFTLKLW